MKAKIHTASQARHRYAVCTGTFSLVVSGSSKDKATAIAFAKSQRRFFGGTWKVVDTKHNTIILEV